MPMARMRALSRMRYFRCVAPRERFGHLARQPLCRWVLRHCKPQQLATFVAENNKMQTAAETRPEQTANPPFLRFSQTTPLLPTWAASLPLSHPTDMVKLHGARLVVAQEREKGGVGMKPRSKPYRTYTHARAYAVYWGLAAFDLDRLATSAAIKAG